MPLGVAGPAYADSTTTKPFLDRSAVEAISLAGSEPAWLREARAAAVARFESSAAPTNRTEGWRRLSLESIDLSPVDPAAPEIELVVADADRAKGVIATSLHDALRTHEAYVRDAILGPRAPHVLAKYSALAEAAWQGGAFVYVPDGVETSAPIGLQVRSGAYPRVVICVGANAKAALSETHRETERLCAGRVDIALGEGARLTYAHVQDCGRSTVALSHQHARLARDAKLITLNFGIGGSLSKSDVEVELCGPGAESDMLGLVFAEGNQQFDYHTLQGHRSPNTRSDLLFKSALDGDSHSVYTGVIVIDRGAQRSDAYQANRNLLLAVGARADTEPKLEIEADDVRCTHGATVGPIDADIMFYLTSRGLDVETASRMIVEGFFQEVFEKIANPLLTEPLAAKIAPHIGRLGVQ